MRPFLTTLALLLAGCGQPVITNIDDVDRNPLAGYFSYAARDGEVAVEVYGPPPGVDAGQYAERVAEVLEVPPWHPQVRFRPASRGEAEFRMVLMFGAGVNVGGQTACQTPTGVGLFPTAAPLRVQGAMCNRGWPLSSAVATLNPPPQGPQDPRFREMLRQLVWALLPPERDNDNVDRVSP